MKRGVWKFGDVRKIRFELACAVCFRMGCLATEVGGIKGGYARHVTLTHTHTHTLPHLHARQSAMENTVWFQNGKTLSPTLPSPPSLPLAPLHTSSSAHTDPFTLFHNAIRHELLDFFSLLHTQTASSLRPSHIASLATWLVDFGQLLSIYLLVQERILYNYIHQKGGVYKEVLVQWTRPLLNDFVELHANCLQLDAYMHADPRNAETALTRFHVCAHDFATALERFFAWEIQTVACRMHSYFTRVQLQEIEVRCVKEMLAYEAGEWVCAAVFRCVRSEKKALYMKGVVGRQGVRIRAKERKWNRLHRGLRL